MGVIGASSVSKMGLWVVPSSMEGVVIDAVVDISVEPYWAGSKFSRSLNDHVVLVSTLSSLCSLLSALLTIWRRLFCGSGLVIWLVSGVLNQLLGICPSSHGNVYWILGYTKLQPMRTKFPKRVMFSRKSDVVFQKKKCLNCKVTKEGINL